MSSLSDGGAGDIIYRKFTTRSFSTGIPTILTGSPVISIYKDDSTSQSTAGVTLTANFDSVAGLNHVSIDTSADGTFYSNGSHFELVITTGTVGGTSVIGEVVGSFDLRPSIGLSTGGVNVTQIAGQTASAAGTVTFPVTIASTTNITAGTITTTTNLTNLPAAPTDWLTAAAVKADAVTKIQTGLATPTNITAGTLTTVTNLTNLPPITTDWLTGTGVAASAVTKIQAGLATPTNITAGTLTTVTNLTNLPSIPANWLTAAGLATDAAAEIGGAVWDVTLASHLTTGSTGEALSNAGTGGGGGGLDAAGVRAAIGMASANLDTQLSGIRTAIPSAAANATEVWEDLLGGGDFDTVGSIGKLLKDDINATISSRSTYAGADTTGTTTLLARLTAIRAANLDFLDAPISGLSTYDGADTPGTTTLLARLTGVRAGLLDNLVNLDVATSTLSTYAGGDTPGTTTLLARISSSITISGGGVKLSSDGLNYINAAEVTAVPNNFREQQQWLYQRLAGNVEKAIVAGTGTIVVKTGGGPTATTQTITDDGLGNQTQGVVS